MMGLEKLLRGQFGSVPQLDMDNQWARARVIRPQTFDFKALVDGIKRNNVGTAGIQFEAMTEIREKTLVIQPTGQSFSINGPPPAQIGPMRRRVKVLDWQDPLLTTVEVVKELRPGEPR